MKNLNPALLRKFLRVAGDKLKGKWLLVGGTLLPAVGIEIRSTVDIDLIGLGEREMTQNLELMELAESLGLAVESVNQAAAFFLKKTGYMLEDLLVLHKGKQATIFRPSLALYWKLKAGRLTESDFEDCRHYLRYCRGQNDVEDRAGLKAWLAREAKIAGGRAPRLLKLHEMLG